MKHKFFIIFLSILILFFACNQNKTCDETLLKPPTGQNTEEETINTENKEEAQKQQIVDDIKNLLQTVTPILRVHNDNAWDEDAQGYNLSGQGQIFSVINHNTTLDKGIMFFRVYNNNDDGSKIARREVYLAFEYNKDYINAFATLANKLVERTTKYDVSKAVEDIMKDIREYAKAYYLQAFDMINKKKDELKKLSLDNLNTLHDKINEIQEAKTNIVNIVHKIKEDYDTKIKVGSATLQTISTATDTEIIDYLNSKRVEFANDINTIKQEANEITNILTSP
ncbi:virulence associated lipoprotein [Borrelia puertoricensis]|uniref:virulence associated lipoprotein n=1 Tax=Borrelia puertoricensis TaxID=2756107 RepID=UPI001FF34287|nr:virulence associated lipoprotein [Borrelia puertoricensis]UPA18944.1 hypothetical protein bpuSUM_001482 [Borrelia puertoricensis]